ncbi:MAG: SDR family oxidoreductase [Burkholderiales bacterium]|nr:SDR family oxidoreductase [Burkholderiales bacterium]
MRFTDRTAVVTGAASGIGRAVAQRLAEEGARVAIADLDGARAETVANAIRASGATAIAVQVDVSRPDDAARLAAAVARQWGSVDILVHSAGVGVERTFLETTPEDWRRIIDIDLSGTFYTCQALARLMVERGYGRIVTLASTAGVRGGTGRAAYGAAKGGVIALTRVMAVELAPHGVTVNALAPGAIETELVKRMHSAETRVVYRAGIPLDRYGTPEETAAAALFLASDEARYITGEVLAVDGGFLAAGVMHAARRQAPPAT